MSDPSFETCATGQSICGNNWIKISSDNAGCVIDGNNFFRGNKSAHVYTSVKPTLGIQSGLFQVVQNITPGRTYVGKVNYFKDLNKWGDGVKSYLEISFYDASFNPILSNGTIEKVPVPEDNFGAWHTLEANIVAPDNAVHLKFTLHISKPSGEFGISTINFDNCSLIMR